MVNTPNHWVLSIICLAIGSILVLTGSAYGTIQPEQLVLVVNKTEPEALGLARYYMEKRHVPPQNLITLTTSRQEVINREEYTKHVAAPVRSFLMKNDPEGNRYACLVLFYGIPLRVSPPRPSSADEKRIRGLRTQLSMLKTQAAQQAEGSKNDITKLEEEISRLSNARQGASVDSEIALVMEDSYPLDGWVPNKYFAVFRGRNIAGMPQKVMTVCRLDGPTAAMVYRIIDDSLWAEDHGLAGTAYFDARWLEKDGKESVYQIYDRAIHNTARIVEKSAKMPVVLDEREALFGPGDAPNAALYCGWYSLGQYIDAFTWARGAVGFHVASAECTTLRAAQSTVWCKQMLEKGVAATLGPVAEPYLQTFPAPEVFFGGLLAGGTLVECFTIANPFWSWQMVLIGDPLYRPFQPSLERK